MVDFQGLDHLRNFGGILQILNNSGLRSLSGIDSLKPESISDQILLESRNLEDCSQKSVCQYLSKGYAHTIRDNAKGCQNKMEILEFCQRSGITVQPGLRIKTILYPNPTTGLLQVRDTMLENVMFNVYDGIGSIVKSGEIEENKLDISSLASGMYIVDLIFPDHLGRERIIKIE